MNLSASSVCVLWRLSSGGEWFDCGRHSFVEATIGAAWTNRRFSGVRVGDASKGAVASVLIGGNLPWRSPIWRSWIFGDHRFGDIHDLLKSLKIVKDLVIESWIPIDELGHELEHLVLRFRYLI